MMARTGRSDKYLKELRSALRILIQGTSNSLITAVSAQNVSAAIDAFGASIWTRRKRRRSYELFFEWAEHDQYLGSPNPMRSVAQIPYRREGALCGRRTGFAGAAKRHGTSIAATDLLVAASLI